MAALPIHELSVTLDSEDVLEDPASGASVIQVWTLDGNRIVSCRPARGRAGSLSISDDGTRMVAVIAAPASTAAWQPVLYSADDCREIASLGAPGKAREPSVQFGGSRVLVDLFLPGRLFSSRTTS